MQVASGSESEGLKEAVARQRSADAAQCSLQDTTPHPTTALGEMEVDESKEEEMIISSGLKEHYLDAYLSAAKHKSEGDFDSANHEPVKKSEYSDLKGTYFEDKLDNKRYLIKASGTIVDVDRKKKKVRKIPMSVNKPTSNHVAFLTSPIKGRDPVMFFPYPNYVTTARKDDYGRVFYKHVSELGTKTMRFKISETTNIYNAVVNS